jgi:hypothetical protein
MAAQLLVRYGMDAADESSSNRIARLKHARE